MNKLYYITLKNVLIASGLTEADLQSFLKTTTYNYTFPDGNGNGLSGRDMPTIEIYEDEIVRYYYDSVIEDYGNSWHQVVESLEGVVYDNTLGGDCTNTTPCAYDREPTLRGKVEILGLENNSNFCDELL